MKFSEAVEYFNSSPASVFLVNEGTYHNKGSEEVKKGESVPPLWAVCAVFASSGEAPLAPIRTSTMGQRQRVTA